MARPPAPDVVRQHLEKIRTRPQALPDVETLRIVVQDLTGSVPMATTLGRTELSGWSAQHLADTVDALGTFLGRTVHGTDPVRRIERVRPTPEGMLPLEGVPAQANGDIVAARKVLANAAAGKKVSAKALVTARQTYGTDFREDTRVVVIPDGWEVFDDARSLSAALAAILYRKVEDTHLDRFVARTFHTSPAMVTSVHVNLLAWLGQTGLWTWLVDLDADQHGLAETLAITWDWVDRHIARTEAAWHVLTAADADLADENVVLAIHDAAVTTRWVAAADSTRISAAATDLVADMGNSSLTRILTARLRRAHMWNDTTFPTVPSGLNAAHAHMLCEASGLLVDPKEQGRVRSHVRAFLIDLGAKADLDVEVPEGISAWAAGLLGEFEQTRRARASGDLDWHRQWVHAVEQSRTT